MSRKLNRDEILREMLQTLIKGWGHKDVYDALDELVGPTKTKGLTGKRSVQVVQSERTAVQLVQDLQITKEQKELMLQFARDYDAGTAFPTKSDVKAFLASHHQSAKELRSRNQAFSKMIPILIKMSEKGLLTLMSRARHSGPAELGSISDAIKYAGENLRGASADDAGNEG